MVLLYIYGGMKRGPESAGYRTDISLTSTAKIIYRTSPDIAVQLTRIDWEDRREAKPLCAEVEWHRSELEAKCVEMQSLREKENLKNEFRESLARRYSHH